MTPIRVMVVDDHAVVRDGLRALLATRADIAVVSVAADGVQAVHDAREMQPDVVLMDLGMPRMDGVEATRRITAQQPAPTVIVLTMSDDDTSVLAAVRAGARGYLLKDADGDEVVGAIHAVIGGQAVFRPGVAGTVLGLLHNPPARQDPPFKELSNRERQVLDLVADGLGNQATPASKPNGFPSRFGNRTHDEEQADPRRDLRPRPIFAIGSTASATVGT